MTPARSPVLLVGALLLALLVGAAALAPQLAPYDPRALAGPSLEPPSAAHLLGTNDVGQDVFSRVVWGTRPSLTLAVGAATLSILVGGLVGATAALVGGPLDMLAMRLVDVFLAVPALPLAVLTAALLGPSRLVLTLVIGFIVWPVIARIVRSQALTLRTQPYVVAARAFGGGSFYLLRRHLLPALGPILVAGFANIAAQAVLLEAGLGFLGLADPTDVSWGLMMHRALLHPGLYFTAAWAWWVLPAGLAITLAVLGFTLIGVGSEAPFNPRWTPAG